MTTAMNNTYINALLADASYVGYDSNWLDNLEKRLTQPLANFITQNFEVVTQTVGSNWTSGFSATVWHGKAGTDYAGQIYLSMRGTDPVVDFIDDLQLATTGVARLQMADMVNWWLKATTPKNDLALQITVEPDLLSVPPGYKFVVEGATFGTGELTGSNAISAITSINGHSLGGYLATAFERIFGGTYPVISAGQTPVGQISTFNSAGYSNIMTPNINHAFNQISQAIFGIDASGFNPALQTNYFGENGFEVTTNVWRPIGFNQIGQRVALYQEDAAPTLIDNHYMYKLTDLLALGDVISKLDNNFNITQLNDLVKKSSNDMDASYEKLLDGLRQTIMGGTITDTQVGDTSSTAVGSSRVDYHNNLKALTDSTAFQALIGKPHHQQNKLVKI